MNRFASTIAALGLALGMGLALPAAAAPYYHVSVDTSSISGQDGYLDFLILALADEGPVHATISNVSESATGPNIAAGDVDFSHGPGVTIGNGDGWNEYGQAAHFGDHLSFDLAFALDPTVPSTGNAYTTLQVALLGADGYSYLGFDQDLVDFDLRYGDAPTVSALADGASVAQVPEAPALWLSVTGLGLLGAVRRRARTRPARGAALPA
jgi:hypothetical protein